VEVETFREWLAARGCRFDGRERVKRGLGHGTVTVHRDGRSAELPLIGTKLHLDSGIVSRICDELGLDQSELPGPSSRV
jgi:hypothetical protein